MKDVNDNLFVLYDWYLKFDHGLWSLFPVQILPGMDMGQPVKTPYTKIPVSSEYGTKKFLKWRMILFLWA